MAALTAARDTAKMGPEGAVRFHAVKASTKIYAGALVAIDATGYAIPFATATTLRAAGRARATADNSSGSAGAINVEVETGVFLFDNADCVQADIGTDVYATDDHTITHTSTGASIAGKLLGFGSNGTDTTKVWVKITTL
jgi:hypothetical protein